MPVLISGLTVIAAYLLPAFSGIFNTGSALGAGIGALLCAGAFIPLFSESAAVFLKNHTALRIMAVTFILAILSGCVILTAAIAYVISGMHTTAESADVLIVLGCLVRGDSPSKSLACRIEAAENYLREHPDAVAVLSGGQGENENISEAACMYRCMTEDGIDPSRLYLEEHSTNTYENIRFSTEVMETHGLYGRTALVTSSFHLRRAELMAARQGMKADGIAAASSLYTLPVYIMREAAGILYLLVFGYE